MSDDAPAVLISIRPQFAEAISDGTKTIELRRRFPDICRGTWLVLYVTRPVRSVVGMVEVDSVLRAPLDELWPLVRAGAGINRATFSSYFAGCEEGSAIFLGKRCPLAPISPSAMHKIIPGFRPPQSFRYVPRSGLTALAAHVRRTPTFEVFAPDSAS